MRLAIPSGRHRLALDLAAGQHAGSFAGPAPLADPADAVRAALEAPLHYPPLHRALTPDDHIAVLVDEELPDLAGLLVPLLDHIMTAGIAAEAITLLCLPGTEDAQDWVDDLPERHEDVHVEVHDPKDRRKLSYLATTAAGRRLYLNRTAVDADQLVVLSGRRFDLCLGYGGAEGAIFPALSDEETRREFAGQVHTEIPGKEPWPARREAIEVTWLLGQPFFVQAIASAGEGVAGILAGASDACREGERLLDQAWKIHVGRRADVVVATLAGDPSCHTFADLARAAACAARVVQPGGRVVLLTEAHPVPGPGGEVLRAADEPRLALAALQKAAMPGSGPAVLWAHAAAHARLYVLGGWTPEVAEELFVTPLGDDSQLQRLVSAGGSCLILEDAHRMMAVAD
jgi:nickel-dependent lactate racemase